MRQLVEGLAWESGWQRAWEVPDKAAIFKARERLGREPLELLFRAAAAPLAGKSHAGAFYRELRLMSLDGTCLDVADTPQNEAAFGRPGTGRGRGRGRVSAVAVGRACRSAGRTRSTRWRWGRTAAGRTRWLTSCWARSAGHVVPGRPRLLQLRALPERPQDGARSCCGG